MGPSSVPTVQNFELVETSGNFGGLRPFLGEWFELHLEGCGNETRLHRGKPVGGNRLRTKKRENVPPLEEATWRDGRG